jgi:RNA polymerase sigma-70 factor (ECF subfamily)
LKITEDNVVQQILKRNEKGIAFIIHQYGGLLTAIIKRQLNNQQQDYEECLDDVLLAVWNNISSFDPAKNSFKHWIAAIAKYKAIDYQRRQSTMQNKQLSVAEMDESIMQTGPQPGHDRVEELLEQLSAGERYIFEKYYLEGRSSGEIARHFNAKESWVNNKLSRGRKKLRNLWIRNQEEG